MATQVRTLENRFPQRILQADGLFELAFGAGLALESETVARWMSINSVLLLTVGIMTVAFGAGLLYISGRNVTRQTLQMIAVFNLAWVAFSAFILVADWNILANEGRWLVALVADVVLVLGLAELYARRFTA
jgi:hypothetical protein